MQAFGDFAALLKRGDDTGAEQLYRALAGSISMDEAGQFLVAIKTLISCVAKSKGKSAWRP